LNLLATDKIAATNPGHSQNFHRQVDHPKIFKVSTDQKLRAIQGSKADVLTTGCPSCLLTLGGNLDPVAGKKLMHPVEIVKKAIEKKTN